MGTKLNVWSFPPISPQQHSQITETARLQQYRLGAVEQTLVSVETVKRLGEELHHEFEDTGGKGENSGMRAVIVSQLVNLESEKILQVI